MLCYHGTTSDKLESILKDGLIAKGGKVWNCSHDAVYCWSKNYLKTLKEEYGYDDDMTIEDLHDYFLKMAFGSGSCSLGKAKDCRVVVVVFETDEEEIEEDDSCLFMESANCVRRSISPSEFKAVYVSNDLSLFKGYFMALMLDRPMLNFYPSYVERMIAEAMREVNIGWEHIEFYIEWEEINLPTFCN